MDWPQVQNVTYRKFNWQSSENGFQIETSDIQGIYSPSILEAVSNVLIDFV